MLCHRKQKPRRGGWPQTDEHLPPRTFKGQFLEKRNLGLESISYFVHGAWLPTLLSWCSWRPWSLTLVAGRHTPQERLNSHFGHRTYRSSHSPCQHSQIGSKFQYLHFCISYDFKARFCLCRTSQTRDRFFHSAMYGKLPWQRCCGSGSGAFLTPVSGMGKNPDPGSGNSNKQHGKFFQGHLTQIIGLKLPIFFVGYP